MAIFGSRHETGDTVSSVTNLSIAGLTDAELSPKGKFAVWASVLSVLFLSQIAYNIGEFPVTAEFVCYALIALFLLVSGYASLNMFVLILYLIAAGSAYLTMVLTTMPASWTSLLLLFALYAPFCVRLARQDLEPIQRYIQSTYVFAVTIIAGIAVVQLILVNGFGASALTNIYFLLPEGIRGGGTYTWLRESGGIVKANGLFLRESSELSVVTALALMIEYFTKARWRILAILAAGLISAVSGSGILALVLGFLLPRSLNRVPVFLISSLALILALFVLYKSEIPGLNNLFFDRLSEFETPGTSGYARYVAPWEMVQRNIERGGTTSWLGNGGGSFFRTTALLQVTYEIADPTWAKLTYEYGFVGLILISTIFVARLYSSTLKTEVCNYILFIWITGAAVLKIDVVLTVWLLTLVPQRYRRSTRLEANSSRHLAPQ